MASAGLRLAGWEAKVRLDEPDAVLGFRVAAGRLRSSLSGFGPLLEADAGGSLGDELTKTAAAIGGVRDAETILQRIDLLLEGEPPDRDASGVRDRLADLLEGSYREGCRGSVDLLHGPAYDAFIRRLDRFSDLLPWASSARRPAEDVLKPLLRGEWSRFRRRGRGGPVPVSDLGGLQIESVREVCEAAERARFVSESMVPVFGRKAQRLSKAAERVQVVLGSTRTR